MNDIIKEPLEGILKTGDFGDSKHYYIACDCGNTDDAHDIEIEADDCNVIVMIYHSVTTDYWTENFKRKWKTENETASWFDGVWKSIANGFIRRVKFTWDIWTKGAVKFQTTTVLSEAAAQNYSAALDKAANDVKLFRQKRMSK